MLHSRQGSSRAVAPTTETVNSATNPAQARAASRCVRRGFGRGGRHSLLRPRALHHRRRRRDHRVHPGALRGAAHAVAAAARHGQPDGVPVRAAGPLCDRPGRLYSALRPLRRTCRFTASDRRHRGRRPPEDPRRRREHLQRGRRTGAGRGAARSRPPPKRRAGKASRPFLRRRPAASPRARPSETIFTPVWRRSPKSC